MTLGPTPCLIGHRTIYPVDQMCLSQDISRKDMGKAEEDMNVVILETQGSLVALATNGRLEIPAVSLEIPESIEIRGITGRTVQNGTIGTVNILLTTDDRPTVLGTRQELS